MHSLETWEQTAIFDPANPSQKKIEKYVGIPGKYATFYFNRTATPGQLKGPFSTGVSTGAGVLVGLMLVSAAIGAAGWAARRAGLIKKRPLSGLGRARRRR